MQLAFQDTNIKIEEIHKHGNACIELGINPTFFGLIPFTDTITNCSFNEPTIMFGGTKLVKLAMHNKLPENGVVFYDAIKFDQSYYHRYLKKHLLNKNAKFSKWKNIKYIEVSQPTFVKPSSDLKYF